MKKVASYMGTVPLEWLKLPPTVKDWQTYETEDIFATNFINFPHEYMLTLGSGINPTYNGIYSSLATTPAYQLPTSSQIYIAGRDVIRWGGAEDPCEIDFDRYIFTPIPGKEFASVFKAPKSEPHHLSKVPTLINNVSPSMQELFKAIQRGEFAPKPPF